MVVATVYSSSTGFFFFFFFFFGGGGTSPLMTRIANADPNQDQSEKDRLCATRAVGTAAWGSRGEHFHQAAKNCESTQENPKSTDDTIPHDRSE